MAGYYVQLFSPHGLIRYHSPEIGRDVDTGGQVKYVLELLESLASHPSIRKVSLFTRRISDKRVSGRYSEEIEIVGPKARIVRIACGGSNYRPKEQLWDHLDEFVDNTVRFIEREKDYPDVVHGHYADGNFIAQQLSEIYDVVFLATGHSLGRNKQKILLEQGFSLVTINERFNLARRIKEEESALQAADAIVVSTQYEIDVQYADYSTKEAQFVIIPPGVNNDLFFPFYRLDMPSFKMATEQEQALYRVNSEIERFLFKPEKPIVLSIGRADKRKNFETIIQAFGQDKELQAMANLAIFAGVRKDITKMADEEQQLLTNLLLLLDKYDLYGKMAIPKRNDPKREVPEIYRIAARKKGVFVNATPGENFGLTLIEAASCGLPVVASPTGGPKEILEQCRNGTLVDVEDPAAIADALKKIIADQKVWDDYSANGIQAAGRIYSWSTHVQKYVELLENLLGLDRHESSGFFRKRKKGYGRNVARAEIVLISDLDGTLVEGSQTDGLSEFTQWVIENRRVVIFGVASGRNLEITKEAFQMYELPKPDLVICSAGSEIYYTDDFIADRGWANHIDVQWEKARIRDLLAKFEGIRLQEEAAQRKFKLSYYLSERFNDDDMANLHMLLDEKKLRAKLLVTDGRYLDVLPYRASKGSAVRYLSSKWRIPLNRFITAGNSGNDFDMLKGKTNGIVVANYSPELEELKKVKSVFFAKSPLAKGVLEGIDHYLRSFEIES